MRLTTEREELQWQEFKNHLEWAELFSLIIFFVDDEFMVDVFRKRLYHQQQGHAAALKILRPESTETLTGDFFAALETEIIPEVKVPLWLELYQRSDDWDVARDFFFSRLNEYRDQLRNNFQYPVIILVPLAYKSRLRDIAPDLWSVRNFTDELLSDALMNVTQENTSGDFHYQQKYDFQTKAINAIEIKEWERIQGQVVTDYELLKVGWRAFDVAIQQGAMQLAESIVDTCLSVTRKQLENSKDSSVYLRYLTVFLNKKGSLHNALGRREAAYELYQESLKISRRLQETLGETPETLRDLSVSLNNVGNQAKYLDKNTVADSYFRECLQLLQRLQAALPGDKEYVDMITFVEQQLL